MKEQVKVKTGGDAGEEQTERPAEPEGPQPRKKYPKRGKRYSRAQKDEILNYSTENSIAEAAVKFDVSEFYVHKQKTCVLFIEDDFSRFIAGWTITPSESATPVIESFEQSVRRCGRPEGVMSDRGSAFHSWKGLSRFEALLDEYEINYYLAKKASVNGKAGLFLEGTVSEICKHGGPISNGKGVTVHLTECCETRIYNWQGMVGQTTACHTATVVTETENAQGVLRAYEQGARFLGRKPEAMVHDYKPIHEDRHLKEAIEPETTIIPATPRRPENKAVIEGEFSKFEQTVGRIDLDDKGTESLAKSAVEEIIRAYTAGINHAGRYEFEGLSRLQILRRACPDPEKDSAFLKNLKGRIAPVIRHIRRFFEAHWNGRFQLINRLVSWDIGLNA